MSKSYVVFIGRKTGIFSLWDECKAQVDKFPGAQYKSYANHSLAQEAFDEYFSGKTSDSKKPVAMVSANKPESSPLPPYLTVDASYSHSTHILEWRGVMVDQDGKKTEVFRSEPYHGGSANIGEFIAIVDGLDYLLKNNINVSLYTDSITAQAWFRNATHKSVVELGAQLNKRFNLAFTRLSSPAIQALLSKCKIMDWKTKVWGEIAADFGRK